MGNVLAARYTRQVISVILITQPNVMSEHYATSNNPILYIQHVADLHIARNEQI